MLVVVFVALGRTGVAGAGAQIERLAQQLLVRSGPAQGQVRGGVANVGAVEAHPDALAHVHLLAQAGVGAAEAHLGAIHGVVDGIAERLVDVTLHVGVKGDHLADGHSCMLLENLVENRRGGLRFPL